MKNDIAIGISKKRIYGFVKIIKKREMLSNATYFHPFIEVDLINAKRNTPNKKIKIGSFKLPADQKTVDGITKTATTNIRFTLGKREAIEL